MRYQKILFVRSYYVERHVVERFSLMFSGEFPFHLGQHDSCSIGPAACGTFSTT